MSWASYPRTGDRADKSIRFTVPVPVGVETSIDRIVALATGPLGEVREWELDQIVAGVGNVSGRRLHAVDGSDLPSPGAWEVAIWAYAGDMWIADYYTSFDVLPGVSWP